LAHHKKKLKLWILPQNKKILLKDGVPPLLAHIYIYIYVRRGGLLAKCMGLKQGAIENTLGEHIGNLRNILKT